MTAKLIANPIYVDHPPLVALMAWVGAHVFGGSVAALRVIPVVLGAATIFVIGAIVRQLRGGRFAQVLAATACAVAPHYLFIFHILSMNASEVFLWALAAWLLLRALDGQRLAWVAFGVTCGLGLMNKVSMLVFGAGIAAGLLLTPARLWLGTRYGKFANVIWILGGDNDPNPAREEIRQLGLGLKDSAPHIERLPGNRYQRLR